MSVSTNVQLMCEFSPENADVFKHLLPQYLGPSKEAVQELFEDVLVDVCFAARDICIQILKDG
jgi:hypothetical protein